MVRAGGHVMAQSSASGLQVAVDGQRSMSLSRHDAPDRRLSGVSTILCRCLVGDGRRAGLALLSGRIAMPEFTLANHPKQLPAALDLHYGELERKWVSYLPRPLMAAA